MSGRRSQRSTNVAYYAHNRAREIERVQARQASTIAFLRALRTAPCSDCGSRFAAHQMDFDHRDSAVKAFRLTSGGAMLKSHAAPRDEARKCDVVCANCHRIRTQARHRLRSIPLRDGTRYLERKRRHWREQAALLDRLRDVPCLDCGCRFLSCAMDFDHRDPGTKSHTVSRMIGRAGTPRILEEVAKCGIVCANCHRARTYDRRMAGRVRE